MSNFKIACPFCSQKVVANESFLGKKVPCPSCEGFVEFPSAEMLAENPELILGEESSLLSSEAAPQASEAQELVSRDLSVGDQPVASLPDDEVEMSCESSAHEEFREGSQSEVCENVSETDSEFESDIESDGYGTFLSNGGLSEAEEAEVAAKKQELPSPAWGAASFTFALGAWITVVGGVLLAPMAIITGHLGCHRYRVSPLQPAPGHSLAALGMVFGYAQVVFLLILLGALVLFRDPIGQMANKLLSFLV